MQLSGQLKTIFLFISFGLMMSCSGGGPKPQELESANGFAVISDPVGTEQVATFAGGCFWAMQECMIELKGVHKVISGYAGGTTVNPTYQQVLSKYTGHAESVQVYYDPKVISFEKLTEAFFHSHDPTQVDRQGPDIGTDYRSIAFFRSAKEYYTIQKVIHKIESTSLNGKKIVTEVLPFQFIYPAEIEHQDYYKEHSWDLYIQRVSKPKVMKLRQEMPGFIKPEYQK